MTTKEIMKLCQARANTSMELEIGRPFGAVVTRNGDIVAMAGDTTIRDHDATAHAILDAVKTACSYLGTSDLSECEIWAVGYPCPMCMAAIIQSGIKTLHVSGSIQECDAMGFNYTQLYDFMQTRNDSKVLDIVPADDVYSAKVSNIFIQRMEETDMAGSEEPTVVEDEITVEK